MFSTEHVCIQLYFMYMFVCVVYVNICMVSTEHICIQLYFMYMLVSVVYVNICIFSTEHCSDRTRVVQSYMHHHRSLWTLLTMAPGVQRR